MNAQYSKKMSLKRPSSDSDHSDRIPLKMQKVWDPYCWLCHKKADRDSTLRCSTCNLSYHPTCARYDGPKDKHFKCDQCNRMRQAQADYAKRGVDKIQFNQMLSQVVERMLTDEKFSRYKTFDEREPVKGGPSLINPFDLEIVSEKVDDTQYKSSVEFLKDIRQIRHNAEIVLTVGMKSLTIAREMEEWCEKEMYDFEMCDQCFERAVGTGNWFTELCNPPHLLVWARLNGYPYWPAKVIGIQSSANKLDVRFFGEHAMAKVNVQDCLIYPSKDPNRPLDEKTEKSIKAAAKEAYRYIHNIEVEYKCKVLTMEYREPLVIRCIGQHLMDMIPTLQLPQDYKLPRKPSYLQRTQYRKASTKSSTKSSQPVKPTMPPHSSLTPPPSPPLALPIPVSLPNSIIHCMSDAELQRMSQFTLKIHRCDTMPELVAAPKQMNDDNHHSNGESTQLNCEQPKVVIDLLANDYENPIGSMVVEAEVDYTVPNDNLSEHVGTMASEMSIESLEHVDYDDTNAIEQSEDTEEMPSPPMELVLPANVEGQVCRAQNCQEQFKEKLKAAIKPRDAIIKQLEFELDQHVKEMAKVLTQNEQLKIRLAEYERLQQHHSIEVEEAIHATKNTQWCLNCKEEAHITNFKLPVCSEDCLLLVWQERWQKMAEEATICESDN